VQGTAFGRYRLDELLGQGGMGQVFRAYDTVTDRAVALKLLPAELAQDAEFQQRFRREALLAAKLNEPHIVPIHNFGEIDGRLYVDMRLIDGTDLDRLLAAEPLIAARAVSLIDQVSTALDAAHRAGLVHRDVKPSNILIGARDFAYLIDFGLARTVGGTRLTSAGQTMGTLAYMAPERFETGRR
jgi:serine/threonine protein kinase